MVRAPSRSRGGLPAPTGPADPGQSPGRRAPTTLSRRPGQARRVLAASRPRWPAASGAIRHGSASAPPTALLSTPASVVAESSTTTGRRGAAVASDLQVTAHHLPHAATDRCPVATSGRRWGRRGSRPGAQASSRRSLDGPEAQRCARHRDGASSLHGWAALRPSEHEPRRTPRAGGDAHDSREARRPGERVRAARAFVIGTCADRLRRATPSRGGRRPAAVLPERRRHANAWRSTDHRPPTTDRRPPTTDHRPPTTDHRPPTTDHRPPTTDHRPPTTDHRPPTTDHRPPTADRRPPTPPTTDHRRRPPTADRRRRPPPTPPTTDHRPPTTDHRPPTTDRRPPHLPAPPHAATASSSGAHVPRGTRAPPDRFAATVPCRLAASPPPLIHGLEPPP
jgi:hypothetical protein